MKNQDLNKIAKRTFLIGLIFGVLAIIPVYANIMLEKPWLLYLGIAITVICFVHLVAANVLIRMHNKSRL